MTPPNPNPEPDPNPGDQPTEKAPDKATYDLEPHAPSPPPAALTPKIDAPGLTDDFDEDADFDHDPAMPKPPTPPAPKPRADVFVRPGMGNAQVVGTLGVVAAVLATVLAASLGQGPWYKAVVISLYHTGVQTLAGVVAVLFAARMVEKPLGSPELAAARMLLAVSAARALLPVTFGVPGTGRFLEGLAVLGVYTLLTWGLFRLPRPSWFVMVAGHAILVVALWLGSSIELWAGSAASPKTHEVQPGVSG